MTIHETLLRFLAPVEPLIPHMLAVMAGTLVVLPFLLAMGRGLWVTHRRFRWMGVFFGMSGGDCLRLACAWIRFLLVLSYLISFRKLLLSHYLLYLVPGVIYVLSPREWARIPGRLFWLALEAVGLVTCNLVCGYIKDMNGGVEFFIMYVLMAVFEALFACYLFLTGLNDISAGRHVDLEKAWNPNGTGDGTGE